MKVEYLVNQEIKEKLIENQKKTHPKGKRRKLIANLFGLSSIPVVVGMFMWLNSSETSMSGSAPGLDKFLFVIIGVAVSLPLWITYLILIGSQKSYCAGQLSTNDYEQIILTDDSLVYKFLYHVREESDYKIAQKTKECYVVPYDRINKVVYNSLHQRIELHCEPRYTYYSDFDNDEHDEEVVMDFLERPMRIYLVYDENANETIVNTLRERVPSFEQRDYAEV